MRLFIYSSLHSLLGASVVLAAVPLSSVKRASNIATVPNKFIVEVDELATIPNKRAYARTLDAVYDSLRARAVEFEVIKEYDTQDISVGAAVTINSATEAAALDGIPGLKAIYPVRRFERPHPVTQQVVSSPNDPAVLPSLRSTHVATGVDKVHARGFFGKGIKIAVIDTGIDYTHPLLGAGFGPGHKVVGGYDFVGDEYNGENEPVPDDDPLDTCYGGHGTHVAGIIVADPDNPYNISGVAYEAQVLAYRVFGCEGYVTDTVMVDSLLRGVQDGADILSMSIGGADGWTTSASAVVASRIARSGKIVTIAAANDGTSGSWYTTGTGNAIDAISCGSVENTLIPAQRAVVTGVDHDRIVYTSFRPLKIEGERSIYALTEDTTIPNDACNPLPDDTPDLSPYIVIIRRGTCTFVQKIENLKAKNATAALVYDNGGGLIGISIPDFPVSLISAADGQFLVESFFAGVDIKLAFPQDDELINVSNPRGGLMSTFSSYGPTNDFHFKPAVSAPGGNILSLIPVSLGSFAVQSGTSMATPFLAGAAALLLEAKGKTAATARAARDLLETTAMSVPASLSEDALPQTLTQQGAGLINVYDAIFSKTIISPGHLVLNDTANYKRVHTFTVQNTDTKAKTYSISHIPAGTVLTVQANSIFVSTGPPPQVAGPASVNISSSRFTLRPGQSRKVTAIFSPPTGLDASRYPVYSGFIQVSGPGENYHVSYLGLLGSLKDKQVVDNTDVFFGEKIPAILGPEDENQVEARNYTFVDDDFPTFVFRLAFGSPLVRLDLVEPDIEVKTNLRRQTPGVESEGHLFSFPHRSRGGTFERVKIVGPLYELGFVSRNNESPDPEGNGFNTVAFEEAQFANGTDIANGSYRFLFRALKVTGDRRRQEDYETWLSPIVGIYRA